MARRRYVPKTYNNRRLLRIITGLAIAIILLLAISFLVLFIVLQRYVYEGELYIPWLLEEGVEMPTPKPDPTPTPIPEPETTLTPMPDYIFEDMFPVDIDGNPANDTEERNPDDDGPERYTIEQIQAALMPQFMTSAYGERNPQVVDALRVVRDRDSIRLEGADPDDPPIDLTGSNQYQVEFRFDQSIEEYNIWLENYPNEEDRPFRREGDYTIMRDYYYFNDVDGNPELAFIKD